MTESSKQSGVALVMVLWVIALLSLMATSFGLGVRREAKLASNLAQMARLSAAAEGAIHYAVFMLQEKNPQLQWRTDGTVYEMKFDPIEVRIQIQDEAGKIDLNQADEKLLQALLGSLEFDIDQAAALADAILDWRDPDDLKRVNGAEERDYLAAGLTYGPANAPFQSIEELALVLGVTPRLATQLLPWVTVHTRRGGINPRLASKELLLALPGIDPQMVESYVEARSAIDAAGAAPPPLPAPPGVNFHNLSGRAFGIYVQAREGNNLVSYQTVIQNQGIGQARPFSYLEWRQAPPPKSLFDVEDVISVAPEADQ